MALKRSKNPIRQITEIRFGGFPPRIQIVRYAPGQTSFDFLRNHLAQDDTLVDEHEGQPFPPQQSSPGPQPSAPQGE